MAGKNINKIESYAKSSWLHSEFKAAVPEPSFMNEETLFLTMIINKVVISNHLLIQRDWIEYIIGSNHRYHNVQANRLIFRLKHVDNIDNPQLYSIKTLDMVSLHFYFVFVFIALQGYFIVLNVNILPFYKLA
jgi:hypothetical protein